MQQIDPSVLPSGEVLHQAHNQAVLGVGLDYDGRDLVLAKCLIGFQSALTTHQGVSRAVFIFPTRDRDWSLQTQFSNVRYDFLEYLFVANTRIDHGNAFNGNEFNRIRA